MASEEMKFYGTARKPVEVDYFFSPLMENASVTLQQMDRGRFPAFLRALQYFSPMEKMG